MQLDPATREQLREALLAAFPTEQDLRELTLRAWDVPLQRIVGGGNLDANVADIIRWGEAHGRVGELVSQARQLRPSHPLVQNLPSVEQPPSANIREAIPTIPGALRDALRARRLMVWVGDGAREGAGRLLSALRALETRGVKLPPDSGTWRRDDLVRELARSYGAAEIARALLELAVSSPATLRYPAVASLQGATWMDAGWCDDLVRAVGDVTRGAITTRGASAFHAASIVRPFVGHADGTGWALDDDARRDAVERWTAEPHEPKALALLVVGVGHDDDDLAAVRQLRRALRELPCFVLAEREPRVRNLADRLDAVAIEVGDATQGDRFLERLGSDAAQSGLLVRIEALGDAFDRAYQARHAEAGASFEADDFEDAHARWSSLLEEAARVQEATDDEHARRWALQLRVHLAACEVNLQRVGAARESLAFVSEGFLLLDVRTRALAARIAALLGEASLAERLLETFTEVERETLAADLAEATLLLGLRRGEDPPVASPTQPRLALMTGIRWLELGDAERAAIHGTVAFDGAKNGSLAQAFASALLFNCLSATVSEWPNITRGVPREARAESLRRMTRFVDEMVAVGTQLRAPKRERLEIAALIAGFTGDDESLRSLIRSARALEIALENSARETPLDEAMALLQEGRPDEARKKLPEHATPWVSEFVLLDVLWQHRRYGEVQRSIGALVDKYPGHAPIEHLAALALQRDNRIEDAVVHAQRAVEELPARGYLWTLSDVLLGAGRFVEADAALSRVEGDSDTTLRLRIQISARVAPGEQLQWIDRYLARHPDDLAVWIERATAQMRLGNAPGASTEALETLKRFSESATLDNFRQLIFLASLRGGTMTADERDTLRQTAEALRRRFPTDPEAEVLRLELRQLLPAREAGIEIDGATLARSSHIVVGHGAEELVAYFGELRESQTNLRRAYQLGEIAFDTYCANAGVSHASFVAALKAVPEGPGERLTAPLPVRLAAWEPPPGAEILLGQLELLLLERLGLLGGMRRKLGERGACLVLFEETWERVIFAQSSARGTGDGSDGDLARSVASVVGAGVRDGWVRTIPAPPEEWPEDEPADDARAAMKQAFFDAVLPQRALRGHPMRFLLSADFLTSLPASQRGWQLQMLRPVPVALGEALLADVNDGIHERVVSLDEVLDWLAPERASTLRERLSAFGFSSALRSEDLLRILQDHGLISPRATAVLDGIEAPLRELEHRETPWTANIIANVYAATLFRAFTQGDGDVLRPDDVLVALLSRADELDARRHRLVLDHIFGLLLANALTSPKHSFVDVGDGTMASAPNSRVGQLWEAVHAWCGGNHARHIALGRGIREMLVTLVRNDVQLDELRDAVLRRLVKALPEGGRWLHPAGSALTVLSPFLGETVSKSLEAMLGEAAKALSDATVGDGAYTDVRVHPDAPLIPVSVDALLVRAPAEVLRAIAPTVAARRAARDMRTAKMLRAMARDGVDAKIRRAYALQESVAPWREVHEDPAVILSWLAGTRTGFLGPHSIDGLREMLAETDGDLDDRSIGVLLQQRVAKGSIWFEDRWSVFSQATELPGIVSYQARLHHLLGERPKEQGVLVREALAELDRSYDLSVGSLSANLYLLTFASRTIRRVTLPDGREFDLRARLPGIFLDAIRAARTPSEGTLAQAEDAALRVCGAVVQVFAAPRELPLYEGVWLTWRLYQWWTAQCDACHPSVVRDALEQVIRHAPPLLDAVPDARRTIYDPFGYGGPRYNRRLAAILFVLASAGDAHRAVEAAGVTLPDDLPALSSSALEDLLLELAQGPISESDRALRVPGAVQEKMGWIFSAGVVDVALSALLAIAPHRITDAQESARRRWIEGLPRYAGEPGRYDAVTAGRVFTALTAHCAALTPGERAAFGDALRVLEPSLRHASVWRWSGFTALFHAGDDDYEGDVRGAMEANLDDVSELVHELLSVYLLTLAERSPERWIAEARRLLRLARDPGRLTSSIASVMVRGPREQFEVARELLLQLSREEPYRRDERHRATLASLGLSAPAD